MKVFNSLAINLELDWNQVAIMGERSRAPATEAAAEKLSLSEFNQWISRAEFRAFSAGLSASLTKSAMKRLVWLEAQREKLYGVPAPRRGRF